MITLDEILLAEKTITDKIQVAVDRLLELPLMESPCIGHSGGKDSVVNHWLVTHVEALPVVHTSKPGGDNAIHPDTLEFLYKLPFSVELWPRVLGMNPKYKTQYDGSRASEYNRTDRSADFILNGSPVNRKELELVIPNSMFGMTFIFPMFDWSDADVWATIFSRDLPFSLEYTHEQAIYQEYCNHRASR